MGNIPELGAWDPKKSVQLSYADGALRTDEITFKTYDSLNIVEYKLIKCKIDRNEVLLNDIIWEDGGNRKINIYKYFEKIGID